MSEMVERVARAIGNGLLTGTSIAQARRAIEAMREPTKAMIDETLWNACSRAKMWQTMIDDSLQDPEKSDD